MSSAGDEDIPDWKRITPKAGYSRCGHLAKAVSPSIGTELLEHHGDEGCFLETPLREITSSLTDDFFSPPTTEAKTLELPSDETAPKHHQRNSELPSADDLQACDLACPKVGVALEPAGSQVSYLSEDIEALISAKKRKLEESVQVAAQPEGEQQIASKSQMDHEKVAHEGSTALKPPQQLEYKSEESPQVKPQQDGAALADLQQCVFRLPAAFQVNSGQAAQQDGAASKSSQDEGAGQGNGLTGHQHGKRNMTIKSLEKCENLPDWKKRVLAVRPETDDKRLQHEDNSTGQEHGNSKVNAASLGEEKDLPDWKIRVLAGRLETEDRRLGDEGNGQGSDFIVREHGTTQTATASFEEVEDLPDWKKRVLAAGPDTGDGVPDWKNASINAKSRVAAPKAKGKEFESANSPTGMMHQNSSAPKGLESIPKPIHSTGAHACSAEKPNPTLSQNLPGIVAESVPQPIHSTGSHACLAKKPNPTMSQSLSGIVAESAAASKPCPTQRYNVPGIVAKSTSSQKPSPPQKQTVPIVAPSCPSQTMPSLACMAISPFFGAGYQFHACQFAPMSFPAPVFGFQVPMQQMLMPSQVMPHQVFTVPQIPALPTAVNGQMATTVNAPSQQPLAAQDVSGHSKEGLSSMLTTSTELVSIKQEKLEETTQAQSSAGVITAKPVLAPSATSLHASDIVKKEQNAFVDYNSA